MSDNINFFFRNRKETDGKLYFKSWLPAVYFSTVELLRSSTVEAAVKRYNKELKARKQQIFNNAYYVEKRKREEEEERKNQKIIRDNIAEIINNCVNTMNNGCPPFEVKKVLKEVCGFLRQLDPTSVNSDDPIASGIIDVFEGVDNVMNILSTRTKNVLADVEVSEPEFSNDMNTMLDDFVNIYDLLGSDFDPVLADPITFPRNERDLDKRRILLTIFYLLEGLRHCWSLRPLLDKNEYSENSYVIHAVSRVVDPIFNYYKWNLKRSWESVSNSSQNRKKLMRSIHSGDRPDLQVLLMLDSVNFELVFTEISRLVPRSDKRNYDWKKLNRLCKDGIDARINELFKGKAVENDEARYLINELQQIPFIGLQVIGNRILVFGIDFYYGSFYRSFKIWEYTVPLKVSGRQVVQDFLKNSLKVKCYLEKKFNDLVRINDKIHSLPNIVGNEKPLSSMSISTTL
ncbi:hypothetical protein RhiirA4_471048 [Rhizophagus irregularis]|uniref:Uncharacterized protein n=1 Tax=Rhizophagus irregularis TaxID=588596 RepID=A0A2I1H2K4_9GLOM|nr:hypothetical protein RhiirA4_471048 [Rhizophagus irregularis]